MRNIVKPVYFKRLFIYCLGLFIMAFGVSLSVKSNLGVSPVNSIPKVLSEIFTQLSMGTWTTIIFCLFILIQFLILRRSFKPQSFLQILCSFLFGFFVDASNWLTAIFVPEPTAYLLRFGVPYYQHGTGWSWNFILSGTGSSTVTGRRRYAGNLTKIQYSIT